MAFINGKNCVFMVQSTGVYTPVVCAKSFTINTTAEVVEITTTMDTTDPMAGVWRDYDYDSLGYTLTLEGVLKLNGTGEVSGFDILTLITEFYDMNYRIIFTADDNTAKQIDGTCIVKNVSLSASANAFVQQSFEFIGKGKYTITTL